MPALNSVNISYILSITNPTTKRDELIKLDQDFRDFVVSSNDKVITKKAFESQGIPLVRIADTLDANPSIKLEDNLRDMTNQSSFSSHTFMGEAIGDASYIDIAMRFVKHTDNLDRVLKDVLGSIRENYNQSKADAFRIMAGQDKDILAKVFDYHDDDRSENKFYNKLFNDSGVLESAVTLLDDENFREPVLKEILKHTVKEKIPDLVELISFQVSDIDETVGVLNKISKDPCFTQRANDMVVRLNDSTWKMRD